MPRTEKDIANLDMVARMIRAAGSTVGGYDPDQLARLNNLHKEVDKAIVRAVYGQRKAGVTWESIGEALGMSRAGAYLFATSKAARI